MQAFLEYRVTDFMTPDTEVIGPEASLADAEIIFESRDFNGLPVIGEERQLIGWLTKLDLLRAFVFTPESIVPAYETLMGRQVREVMTRRPLVVSPDMPLSRLLQQMVETRIKSFPVVDGDRLVGVIAREDVLRALRKAAHQGSS